jgi:hypothetical protein
VVSPALERAFQGILRRLGEDALLRSTPVRVHREFNVEMQGEMGTVMMTRVVATMHRSLAPKRGDALVIGTDSYVIDSPAFEDNGVSVRVVLREVVA